MLDSFAKIVGNKNFSSPIMKRVSTAMLVASANEKLATLMGPAIKEYATIAYVRQDVLYIACLSSAATQEIKLHEVELLKLINDQFPMARLKKVGYLL